MIERLNEMALSQSDAIRICMSLGRNFVKHFDKIYKEKDSECVNHWISEMSAWYNEVKEIKLKSTKKSILSGKLRDWFFTFGAEPEDVIGEENTEELEIYDKFCNEVLSGKSVSDSIRSIVLGEEIS